MKEKVYTAVNNLDFQSLERMFYDILENDLSFT